MCSSWVEEQKFVLNTLLYCMRCFIKVAGCEVGAVESCYWLRAPCQPFSVAAVHLLTSQTSSQTGRETKLYRQVSVEGYHTELFFNRNLILLLKNRIKLFCWLSYLSGIYCYLHLFSSMQEMLTMHIIGFSWRGVGVGPIVPKFLVQWGIYGASFGYLALQIYGQESFLIIWFTAYWDKEFHTAIWMPNLVYFKGFYFQVVLFILWESNTFHMPHSAHTKTISRDPGH